MPESPPQVNAFLLCDNAFQQAFSGKWCIIGTFGVIWARGFPVTHAPLMVFIGLSDFQGDCQVRVVITGEKGEEVAGVRVQLHKMPSPVAEFALPFPPVTFPAAGTYGMELFADDQLLAVRSFRVQQAPQAPKPPPGFAGPWPGTNPNPEGGE